MSFLGIFLPYNQDYMWLQINHTFNYVTEEKKFHEGPLFNIIFECFAIIYLLKEHSNTGEKNSYRSFYRNIKLDKLAR